MFLITLGIAINLYIFEPLSCISKLFCWPGVNEVINKETEADPDHTDEVVSTIAEVVKNLEPQKYRDIKIMSHNHNKNSNNENNRNCNSPDEPAAGLGDEE